MHTSLEKVTSLGFQSVKKKSVVGEKILTFTNVILSKK